MKVLPNIIEKILITTIRWHPLILQLLHYIIVKFTVDGKPITIICASPSYWNGQSGYNTNEHLECGADFKTKMEVNVSGCIDVYFTTDVDKFKKYIETDNILGVVMNNINDKIHQYREMKCELEDSIMNIAGVSIK